MRSTILACMLLAPALAPAAVRAQADNGATLYMTRCASCHGDNGQGSNVAPSLIDKSAADIHFMLDTGRMPASVPYINELHKSPSFTELYPKQYSVSLPYSWIASSRCLL